MNLYKSKLDKLNWIINKYLIEIDFSNIHLICNISDSSDNSQKTESIFRLPINNLKEKILIEILNYQFDLEEHFVYLFTNENHEFFKEFELESGNKNLIITLGYNNEMIDSENEKLAKLKLRLSSCLTKSKNIMYELENYRQLIDGVKSNNTNDNYLHFLDYLNKILLINSSNEEEENIIGNSIDNSYMSSRSNSRSMFKNRMSTREDGNRSFSGLNKTIFKQFNARHKSIDMNTSLNKSEIENYNITEKENFDNNNKVFQRSTMTFKKNLITNVTNIINVKNKNNSVKFLHFEKVIEEPQINLIDDKLKNLVKSQKMKEDVQKLSKRESLLSLLKFAIGSNVVFLNTEKKINKNNSTSGSIDICREYMKYLKI